MSTIPTLKVEVAFDDAWNDGTTWTDITSKVRAGSIRHGRSNELEQTSAGVLNLTLDNRDRRFDPFYSAGPYYGKLATRKQIKVTATYSSTTYPLFFGLVSGWPVSPNTSKDMVCQIEAYDWLAYLSTVQLPQDLFTWDVIRYCSDTTTVWFPMGNNGQSCTDKWRYGTKTSGTDYTYTITSPKTGDAPSQWMTGSSTEFDGSYGAIGPVLKPGANTYVKFLMRTTEAGSTGKLNPVLASANPNPDAFVIGVNDTGHLAISQNTGLGAVTVATSLPINDGNWHLVEIYLFDDPSPYWSITVDRVELGTGTGFNGWRGIQLIGMCNDTGIADLFYTGQLAHVMVGTNPHATYEYFRYGYYPTDTFQSMVQNICNYADLGSYYSSSLSTYPCPAIGGQQWNKSALTALQDLAGSVGGRLYVDPSGVLKITPLAAEYVDATATTSQATFSDSGVAGTVKYNDIGSIVLSDEFLCNQVTVTVADGSTFTIDDTTSQTAYGMRSRQVDTVLRNLADGETLANQLLAGQANPVIRFKDWKVAPAGQPSAYPTLLSLWLGYRVTVEVVPNSVGSRLSQELLIEQISHDFVPGNWHITYSGSPARNGWSLEDATYGLLESTTILG